MSEKEVCFHEYCPRCVYENSEEAVDLCDECLAQPVNEDSHKPAYFKRAKKSDQKARKCNTTVQKALPNEWTYRSQR